MFQKPRCEPLCKLLIWRGRLAAEMAFQKHLFSGTASWCSEGSRREQVQVGKQGTRGRGRACHPRSRATLPRIADMSNNGKELARMTVDSTGRIGANKKETTPTTASCEIIDSRELARRCNVPETWIREYTRSRTKDTIPHLKFGRYIRYAWGSPELEHWLQQRRVNGDGRRRV